MCKALAGGILIKQLLTILVLLNIFVGYFAEAYNTKNVNCESVISQQMDSDLHESQVPESEGSDHSDKECLAIHCHFGHCAVISYAQGIKLHSSQLVLPVFSLNLTPIDFIFALLRPPISA